MLTTCAVVYWRPWYQRYKAEILLLSKAPHSEVSMHTDHSQNFLLILIRAKAYACIPRTRQSTPLE